jgi:hypothetical protein
LNLLYAIFEQFEQSSIFIYKAFGCTPAQQPEGQSDTR